MLLSEQGGGRQNGHLLAASDGHKSRAQGDFGLAKTHVAAHQSVHGFGADHVLNHGMYSGLLVGGFFKTKAGGKGFVVVRAEAKRVAFACRTACVEVEQLRRGVAHLFGNLALGFFPLP